MAAVVRVARTFGLPAGLIILLKEQIFRAGTDVATRRVLTPMGTSVDTFRAFVHVLAALAVVR